MTPWKDLESSRSFRNDPDLVLDGASNRVPNWHPRRSILAPGMGHTLCHSCTLIGRRDRFARIKPLLESHFKPPFSPHHPTSAARTYASTQLRRSTNRSTSHHPARPLRPPFHSPLPPLLPLPPSLHKRRSSTCHQNNQNASARAARWGTQGTLSGCLWLRGKGTTVSPPDPWPVHLEGQPKSRRLGLCHSPCVLGLQMVLGLSGTWQADPRCQPVQRTTQRAL